MTVNISRLAEQLCRDDFKLIFTDNASGSAIFVRPSISDLLFERLEISGGESGSYRTTWADVGISVIYGPAPTKGLALLQLLEGAALDPERGWSILKSDLDAALWERKVAELAAQSSRCFAAEAGDRLLLATHDARLAAFRYARLLDEFNSLSKATDWLKSISTPAQLTEAERIAEWPGVLQYSNGRAIYLLACLTIATLSEAVECRPNLLAGVDPIRERGIMWRIQILVDLLCRSDRLAHPLFSWAESE